MASQPTLLILGAGLDQRYAIRTAQEEGLRVLAADMNPNAPGLALADEAVVVSNRDTEALKRLCDDSARRGFPVTGVLVMGTDIPQVAAELALHLGIPGPSRDTGRWTTNKFLMKERLASQGVAVPWFALAENPADLRAKMAAHGAEKYVIKPTDRSGARGVFVVRPDDQDLELRFAESLAESGIGEVIVEEYIPGDQISTESILWRGRAYTPGFVDRNYEMLARFAPRVIENGGVHPSKYAGDLKEAVNDLVARSAVALGVENGVAKGDVVVTRDGKPMIIEMAARLSGGDFSESLIPLGCGVNIVRAAIKIATGGEPDLPELADKWERFVANRYFFPPAGRVTAVKGVEEARAWPWVKKLEVYVAPGDTIPEFTSHVGRPGVFLVVAESRAEMEERVRAVYDTVRIETVSV